MSAVHYVQIFKSKGEALQRINESLPQLLIVGNKRICLIRRGDDFFAVQDSCSHNGESLSKGKVNYLGEIVCPWHGYRFNIRTGNACDSSSPDLRTFPVRVDESGLYVGI